MLANSLQARLTERHASNSFRVRTVTSNRKGSHITAHQKYLLNFSSSDYLDIASHPDIINTYIEVAKKEGLGSGASPAISGYTQYHAALEEKIAAFLKRDRAILFNSGYHANLGVLTTLLNRRSAILADKQCHASIIDGIILSRAKHYRYDRNKMNLPESIHPTLLISESVFSMQGDIAPVKKLAAYAKAHHAMLVIDDAHGIGVLGHHGGGICELAQLSQEDVPCLITPFGKGIGSIGAAVSGSHELIQTIEQFARSYRYSTSLPPAVCAATTKAIEVVECETERRTHLNTLIRYFNQQAGALRLPLYSNDITPIRALIVGSNLKTMTLKQSLEERGIFVAGIRPPSVPNHQACLRISLNSSHTEDHIDFLFNSLNGLWRQL